MKKHESAYLLPTVIDPPGRRYVCVPIPDEQMHILAFLGQLDMLSYWWNWERDPLKQGTLAAQVWLDIVDEVRRQLDENETCGGSSILLRQNPETPCWLEQSQDGGDTWTLAFDYSLCTPQWAQIVMSGLNHVDNLLSSQAASPTAISPYAPETTWVWSEGEDPEQSENRVQALCFTAHRVIDIAFGLALEAEAHNLNMMNIGAFAASTALGALALFTAGTSVAVYAGISAFLASTSMTLTEFLIPSDREILESESIREELACLVLSAMSTRPVSAKWLTAAVNSIDPLCYDPDMQRAIEILKRYFSFTDPTEAVYVGFVKALGQATQAYEAGLLAETCPCPVSSWQYCLPLDEWYNYAETIPTYECPPIGATTYIVDGGLTTVNGKPAWASTCSGTNGQAIGKRIRVYVPAGTTVTEVSYRYVNTRGGTNSDNMRVYIGVNGVENCQRNSNGPPRTLAGLNISGEPMIMEMTMMDNEACPGSQSWAITEVKIKGTGVPLFGACDNC